LQVIFDGNRAVGVQFVHNGSDIETVHVDKEVLLSAGTIGSAKLLMLSGVGPSEHLNQLNVSLCIKLYNRNCAIMNMLQQFLD